MIDKEAVYDEKISPIVQQIIDICKVENIPFVMDFGLRDGDGENVYCLTAAYGQPGMMETPTFQRAIKVLTEDPEFFSVMVEE